MWHNISVSHHSFVISSRCSDAQKETRGLLGALSRSGNPDSATITLLSAMQKSPRRIQIERIARGWIVPDCAVTRYEAQAESGASVVGNVLVTAIGRIASHPDLMLPASTQDLQLPENYFTPPFSYVPSRVTLQRAPMPEVHQVICWPMVNTALATILGGRAPQ
jgi:hypothetical protein